MDEHVHYCQCGEWASFGRDVNLRLGKPGTWTCRPQGCRWATHEPPAATTLPGTPAEAAQREPMAPAAAPAEQPGLF